MTIPENMGATAICTSLLHLVPPMEGPELFWDVFLDVYRWLAINVAVDRAINSLQPKDRKA